MKKYDVLVVGASTTGCWFAYKMAEQGFNVLVIEKNMPDDVSREYDVFHMGEKDMIKFDLLLPEEGDPLREFRFAHSTMISPYGNYPKACAEEPVIGLHKHDYIMAMADRAKKAGAEIIYSASFTDFIYENDKIVGAKYTTAEGECEAFARIVADCSGIPAVARTKLPDDSVVGNFKLTNADILYVVLYYAEYLKNDFNPRDLDGFFMQYKSWSAPSDNPNGAILGIGAFYGYDYAEEIFKEDFMKNVNFPEYKVERIEKGMTPYHTSVYSLVDDGFIALGDAACHTKPTCGEGCTSSLVAGEIAVEVISNLLKSDKYLTKERMWSINKRYMVAQGKDFDSMRPLLMGIIAMNYDEAEYLFQNDIMFSEKILGGMDTGLNLTGKDIADIVKGIVSGIAKGKITPATIGKLLKGLKYSGQVGALYDAYPEQYEDFSEWKAKADKLWAEIGSVAENTCDPEILKKLGYK
ncbi:MAG: NAD(P)/FAD-dependent oxidoreductase [Clostridia bacterium]|nr:NAD(P)/FAD-dependent oxidoreductase [Clostridia bacterium]